MSKHPFDNQLGRALGDVKKAIEAQQKSLYQERRECACDEGGLCAHHAEIAQHLDEAIRRLDLAINKTHERS